MKCITCNQDKEVSQFFTSNAHVRGKSIYCKDCTVAKNRERRRAKQELFKEMVLAIKKIALGHGNPKELAAGVIAKVIENKFE